MIGCKKWGQPNLRNSGYNRRFYKPFSETAKEIIETSPYMKNKEKKIYWIRARNFGTFGY